MVKLIFQPLMSRYSLSSVYLGPIYRAKITGGKDEWLLTGRRRGGLCITKIANKQVLARENLLPKKWTESMQLSLAAYGGKKLGDEATNIRVMKGEPDIWVEGDTAVELYLQTKKRNFVCERFEITHRDFWNKLEIKYEGKDEDAYLAAWFCFHYWFRRG